MACFSVGCDFGAKPSSEEAEQSVSTDRGLSGEIAGSDESESLRFKEPDFDREKTLQAADILLRSGKTQQGIAELQRGYGTRLAEM